LCQTLELGQLLGGPGAAARTGQWLSPAAGIVQMNIKIVQMNQKK